MNSEPHQYVSINDCILPTQVLAILLDVVTENSNTREFEVLEGTGLRPKDIRLSTSLLKYHQVQKIVGNALKYCPISGLGFEVGKQENPSTWGLLGFAMMSVATLSDALVIAKRYLSAGPSLIDLDFEHDPNKNEFSFRANTINANNNMLPFIMEELSLSIISVFSIMLNQRFKFNKVELSYNRPSYGHLYDRYLGCPIEYNCASNNLTFDAKYLDCEMAASNPISAGLAESLCAQSIEKQLQKGDIGSDIKRILIRTPGTFPTMELVAEELGMSPRSLRRKLTELDSSFQAIFDEVRMKMAIQYLQNSETSLDEISEFIGFSDYNNFRKAFKRWTGHPPTFYRS